MFLFWIDILRYLYSAVRDYLKWGTEYLEGYTPQMSKK